MKNFTGSKPRIIKYHNQITILRLFSLHDVLSITKVSKITELSKTTVITIFNYLLDKKIIISTGKGNSTASGGKKPELFELNKKYGYALSIHILNNKLLLSIADTKADLFSTKAVPINEDESADKVTDIISNFINEVTLDEAYVDRHLLGISIASQGVTDSEKGEVLSSSRFPSWEYRTPLLEMIRKKTSSDFSFWMDNHIRFISLAEQLKGNAKNIGKFLVLKAGSDGVGGGIIINGDIYRGHNYLAGEIGHMRLDINSEDRCHCGGRGCFEIMVTYEKILKRAKELYKEFDSSVNTDNLEISEIFIASNNNHPGAMKVMDEFAYLYAAGISNGCLIIDPELVIITGGIVDAGEFFINKVREKISEISLTNMKKYYQIKYTSFYKNGGLIGGAICSINHYFYRYFTEVKVTTE